MKSLTTNLCKTTNCVCKDATNNAKKNKFLRRNIFDRDNESLVAAMDAGDDKDKLENVIEKSLNNKLARKENKVKDKASNKIISNLKSQ